MARQRQALTAEMRQAIHYKKWLKSWDTRPANTPGWTRHHFEEFNYNIWNFTDVSHNNNRSQQKKELERHEIDLNWTRLIQSLYPADDPKSYELLAQVGYESEMCRKRMASLTCVQKVECPLYNEFWEKRADEKAFFERERRFELCTFNRSPNKPTSAERKKWPGCILMRYHEFSEVVVPKVSLLALQQLNYLDFVKSVLHANPLKNISQFTMEELWVAVVTKIYHFEDTLDKEVKIGEVSSQTTPEGKDFHSHIVWSQTNECSPAEYHALVEDYRTAYEVAKARVESKWAMQEGKKREREDTASQVEDDEDGHDEAEKEQQEDYDHDDRAGKRQKTQKSEGLVQVEGTNNGNQYLETEQEKIGAFHFDEADWTDFGGEQSPQATFQFADTGLPLRFKG